MTDNAGLPMVAHTQLVVPVTLFLQKLRKVKPVEDLDEYKAYAEERALIRSKLKDIESIKKELVKPIDEQRAIVMKYVKEASGPLEDAATARLQVLKDWDDKVEQERLRQQRELEERLREQEAIRALERGKEDEAEKVLSGEVEIAVPQLREVKPLPGTGVSYRTTWHAAITDAPAFIKWCVKTGNFTLLIPNMRELDAMAKAKGPFCEAGQHPAPDGVEWVSEKTLVQR